MECVFCRIVAGELPAFVLHEDEATVGFLDINPVNRGHALVIPREHHESLDDLPPGLRGPLLAAVTEVARLLTGALGAPAYNVFVNNGAVAGQLVPHVHFHVLPRWPGDGVNFHARHHRVSSEELGEVRRAVLAFVEARGGREPAR